MNSKEAGLCANLFLVRDDAYAVQRADGSYFARREPVTEQLILRHFAGRISIALYALSLQGVARWLLLDADRPDGVDHLQDAWRRLDARGITSHLELSRQGRAHLWIFAEPVPGRALRRVVLATLPNLADRIEVFPKQDHLRPGQLGSAVRLPFGIHRRTGERYPVVDPISRRPVCATVAGSLQYLAASPRLTAFQLAEQLAQLMDGPRPIGLQQSGSGPDGGLLANGRVSAVTVKEGIGDLRSFISRFVELDAGGRGACPFHPPDRNASFSVHPDGYWVCFHEVNPRTGRFLGGDAIAFYMRLKNLPFKQALYELSGGMPQLEAPE